MYFTLTFLSLFYHVLVWAAPLLLFFIVLITILGQIVGRHEGWHKFNSLYWTFVTAASLGYGDIVPTQKFSKILAIIIVFLGLIFTGILVAIAIFATTTAFQTHPDAQQYRQSVEAIVAPENN